jgi:hypothetical protein
MIALKKLATDKYTQNPKINKKEWNSFLANEVISSIFLRNNTILKDWDTMIESHIQYVTNNPIGKPAD